MSIAILYEQAETDELGIKLTAKELDIDLVQIPFRKLLVSIENMGINIRNKNKDYRDLIENVGVVLNRAQSKNRRLYAARILEALGKRVLNPFSVEHTCFSKLWTLLEFWKSGVPIPRTAYVPLDSHEQRKDGGVVHNEEEIAYLIQQTLGEKEVVIKPDAGSHGKEVRRAKNLKNLLMILEETEPSISNPVGFLAQELVEKWFYDLRVIIAKEYGKEPYCHAKALARGGFRDFRTNTYLGNMVFDVDLPTSLQEAAVRCGEAVGKKTEAWVLALDAMPIVGDDKFFDEAEIQACLDRLIPLFGKIKAIKRDEKKLYDFSSWNSKLENAFKDYMNSEAYEKVRSIIQESVRRHKILFHEANSCPEFWEQTRLITGANLAVLLFRCARSLPDKAGGR